MAETITLALDTMGGDRGPEVVLSAVALALKEFPELHFILVGEESVVRAMAPSVNLNLDNSRIQLRHSTESIAMDESPTAALRGKKDSSMRVSIELVKQQQADACVSGGNTGALMMLSHFILRTLPGVSRPAIVSAIPTYNAKRFVRILDLGANVDCTSEHLLQFAIMGSLLVTAITQIAKPKVALLNIGEEDIKGNDMVKQTACLLAACDAIDYVGYIEADAVFSGQVDVVVCDGFVGNVALKTMEGAVKMLMHYVRQAFHANYLVRLAVLLAYPLLKRIKKQVDPAHYNGASLLGLNGIVVKSHGGANTRAFLQAIREAVTEVKTNVPERIRSQVASLLTEPNEDEIPL